MAGQEIRPVTPRELTSGLMLSRANNFVLAVATLVGTIIGVGMFGLPYAAAKAGLGPAVFYLLAAAGLVTLVHLIYGEVVLRTQEKHRLVGYAEIYLGQFGKMVASVVFFAGLYLALLAYLVVGGKFLSAAVSGWLDFSPFVGSLALAAVGFWVIFKGIRITGFFELLMSAVLLSLIAGLVVYGAPFVETGNLTLWAPGADLFLPYGLMLFALAGGSAIPEIRGFFSGSAAKHFKKAIVAGTLIPAAVYLIFMIAALGISGSVTAEEAVSGLAARLGGSFARYGAAIGFLAVITSFFTIGLNIKNSFHLDFGLPNWLSFVLTAAAPLVLLTLGWSSFIHILSFAGGVFVGTEGILLLAIWSRAKKRGNRVPEYTVSLKRTLRYLLTLAFLLGIVYEIVYTFGK